MKLRARASIALLTVLVLAPFVVLTAAQPAGADVAPVLTSVTPDSAVYTGGTTVTITGTGLTGATGVRFGFSSALFNVVSDTTMTAVVPNTFYPSSNPITVTTPAGSSNSLPFSTVVPPPTVASISPTTGPTSGGTLVTVLGSNVNVSVTTLTMGGVTVGAVAGSGPGSISFITPAHAAGAVDVTLTDSAGSSTLPYGFTFGTAPFVIGVSPNHSAPTGGDSVTITGTNFTGATEVDFGSTPASNVNVVSDTSITATVPAHAAGIVDVTVTSPGGTSPVRSDDEFAYGGQPTVTAVSPSAGLAAGGTPVTITGTNFTGATEVDFGSTAATDVVVVSATQVTATAPAGSAGTVDVRVITPFWTTPTSSADHFTYGDAPSVDSVSPSTGPTVGGTTVTITGSGFTSDASVAFGATSGSSVSVVSPTEITVVAPPASAGTVDVTVSTPFGTSATSSADQFTYGNGPAIAFVAPAQGLTSGGTSVTVVGTNFTGTTAVHFGSTTATFAVNSDSQITATAPAGSAGTVDVTVTASFGTSTTSSADHFSYGVVPAVSGISPAQGFPSGGTAVTITGVGFTGATAVHFGLATATFTVDSDTQVTATSPVGDAIVDVTVTTPLGTSGETADDEFTYVDASPPLPASVCCHMAATDGGVFAVDGASYAGSMGGKPLSHPIVGIAASADGTSYWLVASDGGVFTFGDAGFFGSTAGRDLPAPIVGIAATADGHGYDLAGADGAVYAFGDATDHRSMAGQHLNAPVVGITATAHGYFLVAADGGVFAFGDAQFAGSLAAATVNAPIVGMTATGHGYLLAGADGGVFSFGGATMLGSMAGRGMTAPVVGIIDTTDGYVLASADGDDYGFGVHADGLETTTTVVAPVVGIA